MTASNIDKVTLRVLGGAFDAVAKEMAQTLYRMSNSSIIRESEDIGCGIFDRCNDAGSCGSRAGSGTQSVS